MNGMIRGSGEPISIDYTQGMQHDNLQVTMPDGETFTGKAVMVGHSTSMGTGFGTTTATSSSGAYATASGTSFGVVESYTGSMQAVLFGNKGHTMRCKFQYADSSGFTTAGGVGLCETSDGRVVDVQW
jgi:hypothetical protein